MPSPLQHIFSSLALLLLLSACANGNYIKDAPPSYPHENPTDKKSPGTYIGDNSTTFNNSSQSSLLTTPSLPPSNPNAWKQADNGQYYKIGDPYKIGGRWYRPKEYTDFTQSGIASWYGPNFHLKKTANGGIFDKNIPSAAHKTLPIPSVVRVTNKDNGHSLVVKVNDRGPYSKSRVLDLSEKAAEILDFKAQGTANITITYLHEESQQLKNLMASNPQTTKKSNNSSLSSPSLPSTTNLPTNTLTTESLPQSSPDTAPETPQITTPIIGSRSSPQRKSFPYTIQVGAFSQQNNAQKLQNYLRDFYNNVFVVSSARFFKVHIGFSSLNEAHTQISPVRNTHGFPSAFIIKP